MTIRWSRVWHKGLDSSLHLVRYDAQGVPFGRALCGRDASWKAVIAAPTYLRCKTCDRLKGKS